MAGNKLIEPVRHNVRIKAGGLCDIDNQNFDRQIDSPNSNKLARAHFYTRQKFCDVIQKNVEKTLSEPNIKRPRREMLD
jgi:hypothetical protein